MVRHRSQIPELREGQVPWPELHRDHATPHCRQYNDPGCLRLYKTGVERQPLASPQQEVLRDYKPGLGDGQPRGDLRWRETVSSDDMTQGGTRGAGGCQMAAGKYLADFQGTPGKL